MAQAAKKSKKEADEPPRPAKQRKLNASVIPIAAGVRAAREPVHEPIVLGKVVSIGHIPKKTRFDFKDLVEFEIYEIQRKISEKERADAIALLHDMRGTVEVPKPDLLAPVAGSVPVVLDESERLAAYLAHHNPMGCTRHIPTVEGHVVLKDGTVINLHKRQDFIDDDEPYVPYGGYQSDGLCFKLSGDIARDRRSAEHLTRRSQNSRSKLGKIGKTAHQNLIVIKDYRPVPDVMWFLRNPDGKSYIRGDLNPYPPGIVPSGKDYEQYAKDRYKHNVKVTEWKNRETFGDRMDAYEVEDLPWNYDGDEGVAANDDIIQDSTAQGSDATEATHTKADVHWAIVLEPYVEQPEDVVFVRPDGLAMKVDRVLPEHRPTVAEAVSKARPHAGIKAGVNADGDRKISLELDDPRAAPTLRILERRIRMDIAEMHEHLETVISARLLAEAYLRTGTFEVENVSESLPIAAIPYIPTTESPRVQGLTDRHAVLNWQQQTAGFRKMVHRADELQRAAAGRLRVWARADEQRRKDEAARNLKENRAMKKLKASSPARVTRERNALQRIGMSARGRYALRLHEYITCMAALGEELGRLKAMIPIEVDFLHRLGERNPNHTRRVIVWRYKEAARKAKGSVRHALNLGPKKRPHLKKVTAPSVEAEMPTNVVEFVPLPKPEPKVKPEAQVERLVILPTVEKITFEDDNFITSLRRAHMARLIQSGRFKPDEVREADRKAFQYLVA